MARKTRIELLGGVAVVLFTVASCGKTIQLKYTPQPSRIENPPQEMVALITANTARGCVTEPEFIGKVFVVKAVCRGGIGNQTIRFDNIVSIQLRQRGEWFRARIDHDDGTHFMWSSKRREDMERFCDAVAAMEKAARESSDGGKEETETL